MQVKFGEFNAMENSKRTNQSAETSKDSRFQGKPSRDRKQARENKRAQ